MKCGASAGLYTMDHMYTGCYICKCNTISLEVLNHCAYKIITLYFKKSTEMKGNA